MSVERGEARRHLADEAGVEPMVERKPLGRLLELHHRGAFGKMAARRKPDVLEERPAQQQHEIGFDQALFESAAASPGSERR